MVLLVFRSHELHRLLQRYPGKSFYSVLHPELEGYWKFFGRVDLGSTWFFHAPVPPGTTRDNFDFRGLVHAAAGAEFDIEFEHIGFWELRFAVADTYRQGRIFIAGDAAHGHPPYGGYGINTGFEDARNLGWKLAAALQGWAGEGLLDAYDAERRPVFQSTARDFIEKAIAGRPRIPGGVRSRSATGRRSNANGGCANPAPAPRSTPSSRTTRARRSCAAHPASRCSAVGSHAFAARAGHHLAPQPLSSGRNVFEELGDGFTLLCSRRR